MDQSSKELTSPSGKMVVTSPSGKVVVTSSGKMVVTSPSGKMVVKDQQRFGSSRGGTSTLLISKPPEIMLQSKQETTSKTHKKIDEAIANKTGTADKSTK